MNAFGNHSQCPSGSSTCDCSHGSAGGCDGNVSNDWSSVRITTMFSRSSGAAGAGVARSAAAARTATARIAAATCRRLAAGIRAFRTFQMCSAGNARAHSSGA